MKVLDFTIKLLKLLMGAVIIVFGVIGVLVNLHDWIFLFLNVIFLMVGFVLFLTPLSQESKP